MTFAEMRSLYPSAERFIHLNHAGVSPIARPIAEEVHSLMDDLLNEAPLTGYMKVFKQQENLRSAFGRMMNVAPANLSFVRNTSHGLTIVAQAIPFQPGDSIIVPANEYPANLYPYMAQSHRGVTTKLVPARENGYVSEDDLIAACDETTRLMAVSWVQWGTGQRMDLERLGTFCKERGIYFAVDIVQGLGALRIDLGALPVNFAAAGCHKWLLAPAGLGILYIREGILPKLLPVNIGWNSVEKPIDWERLHFDELKKTADRHEEGSPNLTGTTALNAAVELLEAVGFDAVNDRVLALANFTDAVLRKRGMNVISSPGHSGIVAFRHPTLSNETVLNAVTEAGVQCAVRCGNLRYAPHAYSTESEIERAVAAIP